MLTRAAAAAAAAEAEAAAAAAAGAGAGAGVAAEEAEAAAAAGAGAGAAGAAAGVAAAAGAGAAVEEQMGREMAHAQLTRTATLIFSGTNSLSDLIDRTEYSRAMLGSAIDLLHEAAHALNIPMNGAGRIMALHNEDVFGGPLPGSINAARRIAGHLSGILPRPEYLQISECWLRLRILANFFAGSHADMITCTEMLGLADESPQSQRWSVRMAIAPVSSGVARERLIDAEVLVADVHLVLLRLGTNWHPGGEHGVWRLDPSVDLSWAEEKLNAAMNQMDLALAGMRRVYKALELQAFELLIVVAQNQ